MVEEVLIYLDEQKPLFTMTIHWKGGIHTQVQFNKATGGEHKKMLEEEMIDK